MKHKIQVYKDTAGEWRWRMMSGNGRVVAESGEGYKERRKALRPLYSLLGLPEPDRTNGSYQTRTTDGVRVEVHVRLGGPGNYPQRVVWCTAYRTTVLDVIW